MNFSKILLYFCLSFIFGIFVSSFTQIPLNFVQGFFIFGVFLILTQLLFKRAGLMIFGFCLLFFILGIWQYQSAESKFINSEFRKLNNENEITTLKGIIIKEPEVREKSIQLVIKMERLKERILITTGRYPEYQYGDKLKIKGKLNNPPKFEGFNYGDYLKKEGIYSVMSFPEIEIEGRNFGNPLLKALFSFKNKFQEVSENFISPPQAGILEALVFGEEKQISKDWKEKLNRTGTRHITAVSGMNVTILTFLIFAFVMNLGLGKRQAFHISLFLIFLYILTIGVLPSAVRAGIMAAIFLAAQYFGRLTSPIRAVIFAFSLMVFFNPFLLRLDVGFQLSFLAILGLIYFQPLFFQIFKKIPNPKIFPFRTTLSATLAAQIFTLPILVYNFGNIPLVSPITNVFIVPLLAPITILIFIFGISAIFFFPLGFFLSFPVWFSLNYITQIVGFFSRIPLTVFTFQNIHWIFLVISYIVLAFLAWQAQKKSRFLPAL